MRNFKKFLALVLAMLMVSACAVSVSAAYGDQAAVEATGYAEAVEVLTKLGVIAGDGTNFNPNDPLTRAAAAKITAMLSVGIEGKDIEWTAGTTSYFVDVDPAYWGNGYISHVYFEGIMAGTSLTDKIFEPEKKLDIASAIAIAVKAAGLDTTEEFATLDKENTNGHWATSYIQMAKKYHLTDGLGYVNYTKDCTRAEFAQIAYNILNKVGEIKRGFGLETETRYIESVADGKVTLKDFETKISEEAFNAALKAANYPEDVKVAGLEGYKVTILYGTADKTFPIYSVSVDTAVQEFDYTKENALAYVKDGDNVVASKIKINGTEYVVNTVDAGLTGEETSDVIGGSIAAASTNGIMFYLDGNNQETISATTIPTYYNVVAYDDNDDGDFERAYVSTYELAFIKDGGLVEKDGTADDGKDDTAKVQKTVIDYIPVYDATAETKFVDKADDVILEAVITAGVAYSETVPALVCVDTTAKTVDVLKTATEVVGVVSNTSNTYIMVDGTKYAFAPAYFPVATTGTGDIIGQEITIYTMDDLYVNYVTGFVTKNVLVDNVEVKDGAAVVTGYEVSAKGEIAPFEATVIGMADGVGRLQDKAADRVGGAFIAENDPDNIDYNKDGKFDAADNAFTLVGLGAYDADKKFVPAITFEDGEYYSFKITSKGAYYVGRGDEHLTDIIKAATDAQKVNVGAEGLKLEGAYVKHDTTAKYKLAASCTVVYETAANTSAAYTAYSATTNVGTVIPANSSVNYVAVNAAGAAVAMSDAIAANNEIALILITSVTNPTTQDKKVTALADGTSIVRVEALDSFTISDNVYKATDIFTGETVYVSYTPNSNETVEGAYAEISVADKKITKLETLWKGEVKIDSVKNGSFVEGYYTYNTYLNIDKDDEKIITRVVSEADADKITIGVDNIKVWTVENGALKAVTDYTVEAVTYQEGFVIGGQIIIIK